MITSFADKETEKVFNQQFSKKLPADIQHIALRKLIMISNAETIEDLRIPPANRLEKLEGNRKVNTVSELMASGEYVSDSPREFVLM